MDSMGVFKLVLFQGAFECITHCDDSFHMPAEYRSNPDIAQRVVLETGGMDVVKRCKPGVCSSGIEKPVCVETVKRETKDVVHSHEYVCAAHFRDTQCVIREVLMDIVRMNEIRPETPDFILKLG